MLHALLLGTVFLLGAVSVNGASSQRSCHLDLMDAVFIKIDITDFSLQNYTQVRQIFDTFHHCFCNAEDAGVFYEPLDQIIAASDALTAESLIQRITKFHVDCIEKFHQEEQFLLCQDTYRKARASLVLNFGVNDVNLYCAMNQLLLDFLECISESPSVCSKEELQSLKGFPIGATSLAASVCPFCAPDTAGCPKPKPDPKSCRRDFFDPIYLGENPLLTSNPLLYNEICHGYVEWLCCRFDHNQTDENDPEIMALGDSLCRSYFRTIIDKNRGCIDVARNDAGYWNCTEAYDKARNGIDSTCDPQFCGMDVAVKEFKLCSKPIYVKHCGENFSQLKDFSAAMIGFAESLTEDLRCPTGKPKPGPPFNPPGPPPEVPPGQGSSDASAGSGEDQGGDQAGPATEASPDEPPVPAEGPVVQD